MMNLPQDSTQDPREHDHALMGEWRRAVSLFRPADGCGGLELWQVASRFRDPELRSILLAEAEGLCSQFEEPTRMPLFPTPPLLLREHSFQLLKGAGPFWRPEANAWVLTRLRLNLMRVARLLATRQGLGPPDGPGMKLWVLSGAFCASDWQANGGARGPLIGLSMRTGDTRPAACGDRTEVAPEGGSLESEEKIRRIRHSSRVARGADGLPCLLWELTRFHDATQSWSRPDVFFQSHVVGHLQSLAPWLICQTDSGRGGWSEGRFFIGERPAYSPDREWLAEHAPATLWTLP